MFSSDLFIGVLDTHGNFSSNNNFFLLLLLLFNLLKEIKKVLCMDYLDNFGLVIKLTTNSISPYCISLTSERLNWVSTMTYIMDNLTNKSTRYTLQSFHKKKEKKKPHIHEWMSYASVYMALPLYGKQWKHSSEFMLMAYLSRNNFLLCSVIPHLSI